MTLFTMVYNDTSILYQVHDDGSAVDLSTGEVIDDFASHFLLMCDIGWRGAFELVVTAPATPCVVTPIRTSNPHNGRHQFRQDWYEYEDRILEELSV